MKRSLVDIGIELARLNARNQDDKTLEAARAPLTDIEEALGILSREAAFHLRSQERTTQTGGQQTEASFDLNKMSELLDGKNRVADQSVKTILRSGV